MKSISGQTILITGATDGLGKHTALQLAGLGATLLLHGRSPEKGAAVAAEIQAQTGNQAISYHNADFADLSQVNTMASTLLASGGRIDILLNNAGLGSGSRTKAVRALNRDGYELRFTVNYLSHVLLTNQLLPLLADGGKIINVSSIGQTAIDFDDVMMTTGYTPSRAYCQSKLAQIMYTFDLAKELQARGITVNALHPSTYMNTKMVAEHFGECQSKVEDGVAALMHLIHSADTDSVTGAYYDVMNSARAVDQAYDPEARARLRTVTKRLLRPYLSMQNCQ